MEFLGLVQSSHVGRQCPTSMRLASSSKRGRAFKIILRLVSLTKITKRTIDVEVATEIKIYSKGYSM